MDSLDRIFSKWQNMLKKTDFRNFGLNMDVAKRVIDTLTQDQLLTMSDQKEIVNTIFTLKILLDNYPTEQISDNLQIDQIILEKIKTF